jgi:2-succinyl-5-enolpyruvyl-6-hydroxy-3-cyclohexene-1-carboxylate synthase
MSQPNPSTALARVVVDELTRNDVTTFFVAPGSRSTPLALAVLERQDADAVVMIDERSAAFAALGSGRAGRVAAVIVTSGTAVANLYPAVVEASMAQVPMLVLTADRPIELRGVGANQTIDQTRMFGDYVGLFLDLGVAEDRPGANAYWRSSVCHAVQSASGGLAWPGPVQVNIPFREPLVPVPDDGRVTVSPFAADTVGRPDGAPWTRTRPVVKTASVLPDDVVAVERGLVLAGAGADVDWCDRTAAELGWPLITESTAPGRPPQAISTAHHLASVDELAGTLKPQLTLEVGRVGLSRQLDRLIEGSRRVVVSRGPWVDRHRTAELVYQAQPIVPDRRDTPRDPGWRRAWLDLERIARAAVDEALDEEGAITELRVARDAARAARQSVLVVASSMPIRDADAAIEAGSPPVFANRGASGIDGFVSTTLGIARVVGSAVALAGDLSMLHDQNGFLVDRRPDAVFVVVDNDGGGIFSMLPQRQHAGDHFERALGTPHGRDFARYAALHDLEYTHVTDPGELTDVVQTRVGGGLHLVHVRTDRDESLAVRKRISGAVRRAVLD